MTFKKAYYPFFNLRNYKLGITLFVTIALIVSMLVINPISESYQVLDPEWSWYFLAELCWFVAIAFAITQISIWLSNYLDKQLPWEKQTLKRLSIQLFLQFIGILIALSILWFVISFGPPDIEYNDEEEWVGYRQTIFIGFLLSLMVTAIHVGNHLLLNWKNSILEAAELKQASLQAQLQSLKLQLDPHFMFNNFSTLSSLIDENPKDAQLFLDRLSEVHRYMLINLDKHLIPLKAELDFVEAFSYLIQIRFSENLHIEVTIPETLYTEHIPPTTLQLLIENAIKHNIASRKQPLYIKIYAEGGYVYVVNNLQKLPSPLHSSKIGLKNIINRYKLLAEELPEVIATPYDFKVKIPLIS